MTCMFIGEVVLQYTVAMMGYGPEEKNAVLELTYNYGVTEYDKGNAYAQVCDVDSLHCISATVLEAEIWTSTCTLPTDRPWHRRCLQDR